MTSSDCFGAVRLAKTGGTAMVDDEDLPVRKRTRLEKLVLDTLGVQELRDYIGELNEEISRVEADIARKQGHRSAADAFFRKP
jgi:uncharacterized small protein (DUF1192 family)